MNDGGNDNDKRQGSIEAELRAAVKTGDIIRFLQAVPNDLDTHVVREAGGVARVDKLHRHTEGGDLRPSPLWPAKDQASRRLLIMVEDLDEALDDLEKALEFTRESVASTYSNARLNKPFDEQAFANIEHTLKEARDTAALAITDFDWRVARALHLFKKALRPCERNGRDTIIQHDESDAP